MTENKTQSIEEIFDIVEEDTIDNVETAQLDNIPEEVLQFFEIEERKAS